PSGHVEGYITLRWIGAENYPIPECEQMRREALDSYLPAGMKTIETAARREQVAARRRGVIKRFGY
ncbi:MAG: hypothetical protein AB8B81_12910, partial [Halioglobus sp.]